MKIDELLEAKNYPILYHHTKFVSLLNILKTNKLSAGSTGFISFTRNKNFLKQGNVGLTGVGAELVINGSKLSERYKIEPYKYHSIDVEVPDESEERVKKTITNALDYIIQINLYSIYFNRLSERELNLVNRMLGQEIDSPVSLEQVKQFVVKNYPQIHMQIK